MVNSKVSIVLDPETAWQPVGGIVSFTVSGNSVSLDGLKVIVCFGWPANDWKNTQFLSDGRVSLANFDVNSATYSVVVPDLGLGPCVLGCTAWRCGWFRSPLCE